MARLHKLKVELDEQTDTGDQPDGSMKAAPENMPRRLSDDRGGEYLGSSRAKAERVARRLGVDTRPHRG